MIHVLLGETMRFAGSSIAEILNSNSSGSRGDAMGTGGLATVQNNSQLAIALGVRIRTPRLAECERIRTVNLDQPDTWDHDA